MTDAEVLAAIRANHLKANIGGYEKSPPVERVNIRWDLAYLDSMGPGSIYAHVPIELLDYDDRIVVRVYPPERSRKRLAKRWLAGGGPSA